MTHLMMHLLRATLAVVLFTFVACATTPGAPTAGQPTDAAAPTAAPAAAIDPLATNFDYPFPVKFFEFDEQAQKLRMAYLDVAPTGEPNGRTVLLLHGKNFAAFYWEPTIRALTAEGFRVIAPDQVGFGKSSKPQNYQFSFAGLSASTAALLDSLDVKEVSVVAHSMGGMLGTRFALLYPSRVERLVLVNPIGLEDYGALTPYRGIDAIYRDELAQTPQKIREYQRNAYYAGELKPEYEPLMALLIGWSLHPEYAKVAWVSARTAEMIFTQPVVHELSDLTVPTLLIIGLRDRTALGKAFAEPEVAATMGDYPELGKRTHAAIPDSKLVELPGVGHMPQVEAFPQYRDALLEFLR